MRNLIRSIFVSGLIVTTTLFSMLAVDFRASLGLSASILLMVSTFTVCGFFMRLMILRDRPRTSRNLTGLSAVVVVTAVAGLLLARERTALVWTFGLLPIVGWLIYDRWYSVLDPPDETPLRVGEPLPDFTLTDADGTEISSRDFRGRPVLLLFYRGNWCPFCMAQIGEIAGRYRELEERSVQVIFVSPQPAKQTRKLAERHDIPARFLVDEGNRVARELGLEVEWGIPMGMQMLGYDSDTVLPTVVIADRDGTISPDPRQDSSLLSVLSGADALMIRPAGCHRRPGRHDSLCRPHRQLPGPAGARHLPGGSGSRGCVVPPDPLHTRGRSRFTNRPMWTPSTSA